MYNLRNLKLLGKAQCKCGHEFSVADIQGLIKNTDYQFYGGRVEYYSKSVCPECNEKVVLLLTTANNSYKVIDIGKNEEVQTEEIEETEEYKCEKCSNTFKSVQGLRAHQRKCLK